MPPAAPPSSPAHSAWHQAFRVALESGQVSPVKDLLHTRPRGLPLSALMMEAINQAPLDGLPQVWQAILDATPLRREALVVLIKVQPLLLKAMDHWSPTTSEALSMREKWAEMIDSQDFGPFEIEELFCAIRQGGLPEGYSPDIPFPLPARVGVSSLVHAELEVLRRHPDWDRPCHASKAGGEGLIDLPATVDPSLTRVTVQQAIALHPVWKDALTLEILQSALFDAALPPALLSRPRKTL